MGGSVCCAPAKIVRRKKPRGPFVNGKPTEFGKDPVATVLLDCSPGNGAKMRSSSPPDRLSARWSLDSRCIVKILPPQWRRVAPAPVIRCSARAPRRPSWPSHLIRTGVVLKGCFEPIGSFAGLKRTASTFSARAPMIKHPPGLAPGDAAGDAWRPRLDAPQFACKRLWCRLFA